MNTHTTENKPERPLVERLLSAQKRIGVITKDKTNPFFESKYTDINAVIEIVKPILNDEDILVMQPLSSVDGKPGIATIFMHGSERIEYTTVFPDLPAPLAGKKNNPAQEMGSMITYGRRYALIAALVLESADDDGNAMTQSAPKKEQPKAQPTEEAKEIPTCDICGENMHPQTNNPGKWFCKHSEGETVKWGKPIFGNRKKVI